jgi:hypothetical protein
MHVHYWLRLIILLSVTDLEGILMDLLTITIVLAYEQNIDCIVIRAV